MEIKIELPSRKMMAVYAIDCPEKAILTARLTKFSGKKPPSFIRFYDSENGWTSALEDAELKDAIISALRGQ